MARRGAGRRHGSVIARAGKAGPNRQETISVAPDELARGQEIYDRLGFVIVRGLYPEALLVAMEQELEATQQRLIAGELDEKFGSDLLDEPGAVIDGKPYRHYVINCTELSPAAHAAATHPGIKAMADRVFNADAWVNDYSRFGVVFQDARSDAGSHYSRIGWHSDYQSAEESPSWPGFAFTIHIDGTSPANGFLRVVPGSHKLDIDKDELGARRFDPIPGEIPVFAERGDVILHDYKLWHGAARGTAEGMAGRRRHVRGGYYAGTRPPRDYGIGKFYKNAAR
jgi:ectoine hydroxylase-related dioxygenase (phytanoyl-CoA dioxygenase family)